MTDLGLIAGNGEFPFLMARSARQAGVKRIIAVALEGETQPQLGELVDELEWVGIGQLDRLIKTFTQRGIRQAVMAGGVTPARLFKNLRLDWRMVKLAAKLRERNAQTIFGAIADELAKDGVELLDPRPLLGDNVPVAGALTRRAPDRQQQQDIAFGLRIAKAVSQLDIGQTVVVKKGTVLAVEGFEGTDACIRRGGELAGERGGAVVVKVSKADHDFRFDIPCIGPRTVESCMAGRVAVLAVEAGRTALLDRAAVIEAANRAGLVLVAV
ncbi:MAG: UDP-2,3-diacylglucosamine diphosphatase LpxI [Verrucomicrobiae bacterium]|nr:UDP-2,3-diacylglucosamine diphosphatase LpxI [Verrucomicrobiae bacterium]